MRDAKPTDYENAGSALFAGRIGFTNLRRQSQRGNVRSHASVYIDPDGVRVTVPVYDPAKNETMVRILMTKDGRFRVFRSLQAAKNAMHKCGITNYSVVRDGVECWS